VAVATATVPWLAASIVPVITCPPFIVKVTDADGPLVAVTVLGPGVDPKVSTVLAVPVGNDPIVTLMGGAKVSPVALLVQTTVPHGPGMGESPVQSINTTRGLPSAVLADPI